jgi:uncharacterized repeat protein (TIGR04138 family)
MLMDSNFIETVSRIIDNDPRYAADAYEFISNAVNYTSGKLDRAREKDNEKRHISAKELLEGISEYAINEFGPMAGEVFKNWGLTSAKAIGDVVFNMVSEKLLRASEKDSIEDFSIDFDFDRVLMKTFEAKPEKKKITPPKIA